MDASLASKAFLCAVLSVTQFINSNMTCQSTVLVSIVFRTNLQAGDDLTVSTSYKQARFSQIAWDYPERQTGIRQVSGVLKSMRWRGYISDRMSALY